MEGNFLMLKDFQNKFKIKTSFLYYLQLIAAIPSDLKKKAATIEIPSQEVLNTAKLSSSAIATPNLGEMRCKNYYKILSGNGITEPTGIKKWKTISLTISQIGEKSFLLYINPQRIIN